MPREALPSASSHYPCFLGKDISERSELPMASSHRRLGVLISSCLLVSFAVLWLVRGHTEYLSEHSWIVLLALAIFSVSTTNLWLRLRHRPSLRPWLIRHLIGNCVLAICFVGAWFTDLDFIYYVPIVAGGFVMWIWGSRKLRQAAQENKQQAGSSHTPAA